jgi:hypothetical protein
MRQGIENKREYEPSEAIATVMFHDSGTVLGGLFSCGARDSAAPSMSGNQRVMSIPHFGVSSLSAPPVEPPIGEFDGLPLPKMEKASSACRTHPCGLGFGLFLAPHASRAGFSPAWSGSMYICPSHLAALARRCP